VLGLAAVVALTTAAAADRTIYTLHAGLNGAREVPGPGDQNGSGKATITVDTATGEICWDYRVRNIDGTIVAAHIHVGDRQTAGPIVLPLTLPVDGDASGCATDAALADALAADPSEYYVNVHSSLFPAGAVRGQLAGPHS
jgi:hypothetical protein